MCVCSVEVETRMASVSGRKKRCGVDNSFNVVRMDSCKNLYSRHFNNAIIIVYCCVIKQDKVVVMCIEDLFVTHQQSEEIGSFCL